MKKTSNFPRKGRLRKPLEVTLAPEEHARLDLLCDQRQETKSQVIGELIMKEGDE